MKKVKKYQGGGGIKTAAERLAEQKAINEKRNAENRARQEKAKKDAVSNIRKVNPDYRVCEKCSPSTTTQPTNTESTTRSQSTTAKRREPMIMTAPGLKKGGTITALDQVQRMYSKKK